MLCINVNKIIAKKGSGQNMILRLHGKSKRKINSFFRGAFDKENGQNAAATYKIALDFGNSPKWKT